MAEMVIKSSTEESQLSMVEMMSIEEMVPDYFISHVSSQSALAGSDCLIVLVLGREFLAVLGLPPPIQSGQDALLQEGQQL